MEQKKKAKRNGFDSTIELTCKESLQNEIEVYIEIMKPNEIFNVPGIIECGVIYCNAKLG